MANRRCISLEIVDSDAFLEMPSSSQNLYFHLTARSDDDGFCNCPTKIMKIVGASTDDLKLLIAKRFLLECPNGVVLVKHWWIHNTRRKDRYKPSNYLKDVQLFLDENKAYTFEQTDVEYSISWQPNGNQLATQYNIKESNIKESNINRIDNDNELINRNNTHEENNDGDLPF